MKVKLGNGSEGWPDRRHVAGAWILMTSAGTPEFRESPCHGSILVLQYGYRC